jgi:hypothetical protein
MRKVKDSGVTDGFTVGFQEGLNLGGLGQKSWVSGNQ